MIGLPWIKFIFGYIVSLLETLVGNIFQFWKKVGHSSTTSLLKVIFLLKYSTLKQIAEQFVIEKFK